MRTRTIGNGSMSSSIASATSRLPSQAAEWPGFITPRENPRPCATALRTDSSDLEAQRAQFWSDGYLVVEDAVDAGLLKAMRDDFNAWVEASREHHEPYGDTIDGRPRFDLEPGHTAEKPGLRRVNAPVEVSQAYFEAMSSSRVTDCVAELIGPNVKFHHSKINSKLPGGNTAVKWHQDFPFTPHSNDDLVTALLMVDEVTPDNGPLEVVAGSHKGELHGLWHDGEFTGAVQPPSSAECGENGADCDPVRNPRLRLGCAARSRNRYAKARPGGTGWPW